VIKVKTEERYMLYFCIVMLITIAFYAGSVYCSVVYSQTYAPSFKEMEEKLFWCGLLIPFAGAFLIALYPSLTSPSPSGYSK